MTNSLSAYLNTLDHDPQACVPLAALHKSFRNLLKPGERRLWGRARLAAELATAFPVGVDASGKTLVGGLRLPSQGPWAVREGRLVQV